MQNTLIAPFNRWGYHKVSTIENTIIEDCCKKSVIKISCNGHTKNRSRHNLLPLDFRFNGPAIVVSVSSIGMNLEGNLIFFNSMVTKYHLRAIMKVNLLLHSALVCTAVVLGIGDFKRAVSEIGVSTN